MMEGDPLETLIAKQAITEQIYHYCRAMDRIDNELGRSVWHLDGTADFGDLYRGTGAGWVEQVSIMHRETCSAHSHIVSNILIEVRGEKATSESYISAVLFTKAEGGLVRRLVRGRYLDRWSRRDGRWAIDHRHYLRDLSEARPEAEDNVLRLGWGHRDGRDPSYAMWEAPVRI